MLNRELHKKLITRLRNWFENSTLALDFLPLGLASIVGIITGISTVFFFAIELVFEHASELRQELGVIGGLTLMSLAGLITGLIIKFISSEVEGGGVPYVMESIAMRRGQIRKRVGPTKIGVSAVTIGLGGSVGREGPIVLIGGAIGSFIGQIAHISDDDVSMLVASGAAGGISAAFNAPIAASMFAIELILGCFTKRNLEAVIISAISSNIVARPFLGTSPAFAVPAYPLDDAREIPLYILLGIICAIGAILVIKALYFAEHRFAHAPVPIYITTTLGMFLTGIVGIFEPEVLGSGLEFIGETIAENVDFTVSALIALFLLKTISTLLTLGSGNSGGDLAPILFLGAVLGSIVGQAGHQLMPDIVINPGAFALVGMASMFAGAARAPITSIILVLEMSNDYRLIVPLMLGVVISTLLADILLADSIYTLKLSMRGIRLERGQDIDILQSVSVADVMNKNYLSVLPETTLVELIRLLHNSHHHGFPIVDKHGHCHGIVTLTDAERAQNRRLTMNSTVMEFGTVKNYFLVYPDDPIYLALRRMNAYSIGRLPVVVRNSNEKYLGMIRREDILKAYDIGLMRKSMEIMHDEQVKLRIIENKEFFEVELQPNAPMDGQNLTDFPSDFPYSRHCVILSIFRNGNSIIPRGDTILERGDLIVAYTEKDKHEEILNQFLA